MPDKRYIEVALYQLKTNVEESQFLRVSDATTDVYRMLGGLCAANS